MTLAHFVRMRTFEDQNTVDSPAARRVLARTVLERWPRLGLLAFRGHGPRLDLLVTCGETEAAKSARLTEMTLVKRLRLRGGFSRARVEPVRDQWHMTSLFRLILKGPGDPFHEASNLPDLLGLRLLGCETAWHVRGQLPRIKREELLGYLGVPELRDDQIFIDWLVDSTTAAAALPNLRGQYRETVAALRAMLHVARSVIAPPQLALVSGRSATTVRRLLAREADPMLMRAIRLQSHLRSYKGALHAGSDGRAVVVSPSCER